MVYGTIPFDPTAGQMPAAPSADFTSHRLPDDTRSTLQIRDHELKSVYVISDIIRLFAFPIDRMVIPQRGAWKEATNRTGNGPLLHGGAERGLPVCISRFSCIPFCLLHVARCIRYSAFPFSAFSSSPAGGVFELQYRSVRYNTLDERSCLSHHSEGKLQSMILESFCHVRMPKRVLMCALLLLVLATNFVRADSPQRDSATRPTEVIRLFDGKSLDPFYTFMQDTKYEDPRNVFRVTDGMLHVTGDGLGGLVTKKEYRDYHCILEYRWGSRTWHNRKDKTKDSGLLVHSTGADGGYNGTWMPSIEVQIIEGGVGDFILVNGNDKQGEPVPLSVTCEVARDRDGEVIWKEGGTRETFDLNNRKRINWYGRDPDWTDTLGFRGAEDVDSPGEQWTRIDTICDGGHIQVFVNGVLVNEAWDVHPSYGRLQLQTELAEIFVRRWELWPLGKGPVPAQAE
jgi:hypothetical protein